MGRFINADGYVSTGQGILGNNMFAYCGNNPVLYIDSYGTRHEINLECGGGSKPLWIKKVIDRITDAAQNLAEDIKNYDKYNESEAKVLESNYFSSYKGVPVIRTNGSRSGSYGALFITRETNNSAHPEDIVRHEYGHTKQMELLGVVKYTLCIGVPSLFEWGSDSEYYRRPWEITADIFGGVQSRSYPGYERAGFEYLANSKFLGIFVWPTID